MGTALRISEVARRSGFAPPTLRYYEQLGLLPPPNRTAAGYRSYDESVLRRLGFVARAKALGCSLEEIAALMPDWDGGACAPVQDGLRGLAGSKLEEAERRIEELVAFRDDLRRVVASLGAHTPDGPCDHACGCLGEAQESPDVSCSLDAERMPDRLREWQELLVHVTLRTALDGGLRLVLDEATPVAELVRLVEAERSCCGFFSFSITVDGRGLALEVRAPAAAREMVDALFGSA